MTAKFAPITLVVLALATTVNATAQTPCVPKPVTLMVPYPAGGLSDVIARNLNTPLSKALGQTVLVDNLGGAGGSIAANKVLAAPADGQMIFMGSPNEVILTPLANAAVKLRHDQFTLLGQITVNPIVLLARKELPANSIDELITLARNSSAKPLTYGSVGYGSLYHFAGEELASRTGSKLLHVPYRGGAPLFQDLGAGLVDFVMFPWGTSYRGLAEQGRMKILGWVANKRDSLAPDFPAFGEGTLIKDFEYSTWAGLMVRKDTPAATLACLHKALNATLELPEVQKALVATGSQPGKPRTLDESAKLFAAEAARFQTLARAIKLEAQ